MFLEGESLTLNLVNKTTNLRKIFFPDNLIRFEMCAIWGLPGKNNNYENNIDATFLGNLFRSSFYQKME